MFLASENIDFTGLSHVFLLGGGEGCFFCLCNERGRDSKGTVERSEAKKRPVDVFLVPRAGGGTAPVPPDESLSLRQTKKYPIAGCT